VETIEALVRDVVRDVIERVEQRVEIVFVAELEAELERRRNGEAPVETPPASVDVEREQGDSHAPTRVRTKVCSRCGETKPLAEFPRDPKWPGYEC
jgi:hypothetical protein